MVEQKDRELTSSQRHTKIATIYRQSIHESNLKTSKKGLLRADSYKEGTTMRRGEGTEMQLVKTHAHQVGDT